MCFSATASFTTSVVLTGLGIASITQARKDSLKLFASTPIIFGIQQAAEGIIWLTSATPQIYATYAATIFFFFASAFWPVWIAAGLMLIEKEPTRKKLLCFPLLCGIIFSLVAIYELYTTGMTGRVVDNHIAYSINRQALTQGALGYLYMIAMVLPSLISSLKGVWIFGIGIVATYIMAAIWYAHHFASVWCFFGALLSGIILYVVSINKNY